MAKDIKDIKDVKDTEIKSIENELFFLSQKTREKGYIHINRLEGIEVRIDFERDKRGNEVSQYASTGKIVNGSFKSDNLDYLTGLNERLVYILATAGVIKLKKNQYHYYLNYLKKMDRVRADDE